MARTSIFAGVLTGVLLLLVGFVFLFGLLVALNGVSEKQGFLAMGIWAFLHFAITGLAIFSAQQFSKALISRAGWRGWAAIGSAVFGATLAGSAFSFLGILFSILVSGIR